MSNDAEGPPLRPSHAQAELHSFGEGVSFLVQRPEDAQELQRLRRPRSSCLARSSFAGDNSSGHHRFPIVHIVGVPSPEQGASGADQSKRGSGRKHDSLFCGAGIAVKSLAYCLKSTGSNPRCWSERFPQGALPVATLASHPTTKGPGWMLVPGHCARWSTHHSVVFLLRRGESSRTRAPAGREVGEAGAMLIEAAYTVSRVLGHADARHNRRKSTPRSCGRFMAEQAGCWFSSWEPTGIKPATS